MGKDALLFAFKGLCGVWGGMDDCVELDDLQGFFCEGGKGGESDGRLQQFKVRASYVLQFFV